MQRLTELAHAAMREVLLPGEVAIDATAGNGHDTRFLAELVGPTGHVFAFDIQPAAVDRTALTVQGFANVTLLNRDHAEMLEAIPEPHRGRVAAVMFNLGYLPGGDKAVTTQPASTLRTLSAALALLRPGGVVTVIAYPGHPGGAAEAESVAAMLAALPSGVWEYREVQSQNDNPSAPRLFVVHKPPSAG